MSLLTMAQRVARETQEDTDFSTIEGSIDDYLQRIVDWINEGYDQAWKKSYGKNQQAHATGTWSDVSASPYDISAKGISVIKSLVISTYAPINLISFNEFQQNYSNSTAIARPLKASLFKNELHLNPEPDQTYSINYYAIADLAVLDKNTDTSIIDEDILVSYAKYKQFSFDKDFESSDREILNFGRLIGEYKNLLSSKRGGLPPIAIPEDAYYRDKVNCYENYD
ncbi:MAG: hypothetical protein U9P90_02320 [Patescibacteria group bacterium]|nr:hypothetical protein [Patescibacteria group bacterium]